MFLFKKEQYQINLKKKQQSQETEGKEYETQLKEYNFFIKNEIEISQIIIKIPNYYVFFNPILRNSFVKLGELDDRCIENFEENLEENNKKKYILIKKKFQRTQKFSTFFDYFYSISRENPKKYLLNLINTYKHSLKMIKQLENVKLINLNFHPSTLIFKDDLIVLSNFERVFYFQSMNEERKSNLFSKYNKKDIFLPIEAHVICYLLEKNLESVSFGNIEEICADYYGRLCSLSCLNKDIIEEFKETALFSLLPFINKPKQTILNEILQYKTCITWNIYGISILFIVLLRDVFYKNGTFPENSFLSLLFQSLIQNINPLSSKRSSIDDNISLFNDILYNTKPSDFLYLISYI